MTYWEILIYDFGALYSAFSLTQIGHYNIKKKSHTSVCIFCALQEKNMNTTVILLTEIQISSLSSKVCIFFVHG